MDSKVATIDEYIAAAPAGAQAELHRIREIVRAVVPGAHELISYRMPAFKGRGIIVYFGAFKDHIGMFPPVRGDARLNEALARYRGPKGNLRFPLDEPLPFDLIERIVRLRAGQDRAKSVAKRPSKP